MSVNRKYLWVLMLLQFYTILYETSVYAYDMDLLWIKFFLSFVSFSCSVSLSCFMIAHIFKDKHKMAWDINSLHLLVFFREWLFCFWLGG